MSYEFLIEELDNVPIELIKKINVSTTPIIIRGFDEYVAKWFIDSVVEISLKIEKLFKTNTSIKMSDIEQNTL